MKKSIAVKIVLFAVATCVVQTGLAEPQYGLPSGAKRYSFRAPPQIMSEIRAAGGQSALTPALTMLPETNYDDLRERCDETARYLRSVKTQAQLYASDGQPTWLAYAADSWSHWGLCENSIQNSRSLTGNGYLFMDWFEHLDDWYPGQDLNLHTLRH